MPHAITGRKVASVCYGKGAACRYDAVVTYDHRSVVQRGILEEDIHDQTATDLRIQGVSSSDDVFELDLASDDDEGAGLLFRHLQAGLGYLGNGFCVHLIVVAARKESPEQGTVLDGRAGLFAKGVKKTAYLRLEDDDEGDCTHVDHRSQQRGNHLHAQSICYDLYEQNNDDGDEDVDGRGAFYPSERYE